MREEIIYIANDGVKFTSKENCLEHEKILNEKEAINKAKGDMLDSIKKKHQELAKDIAEYKRKYNEPVLIAPDVFSKDNFEYLTFSDIMNRFF